MRFLTRFFLHFPISSNEKLDRGLETRLTDRCAHYICSSCLVLSDEVLPHMLDAGMYVEHIVHYDMPSTKAEFRQRLALFYKSMKR